MKKLASKVLFLRLRLSHELCNYVAIWWGDIRIIVLDCACDFESVFLVELDGFLIVCLDMKVDLAYVLLHAKINHVIHQLCT